MNLLADSVFFHDLEGDGAVASAIFTAIVLAKCNLTFLLAGGRTASPGDWPITAFPMASVHAFCERSHPMTLPPEFLVSQNTYWRFSLPYQTAVWHSTNFCPSSFENLQGLSESLLKGPLGLDYCRRERFSYLLYFNGISLPRGKWALMIKHLLINLVGLIFIHDKSTDCSHDYQLIII